MSEPVIQPWAQHSSHSSYREKLLEHLFVGEVLRTLWKKGIKEAEFLRPEVDNGGYDIVLAYKDIVRHIQLKSSYEGAKTAKQTVNMKLGEKPSGCVVWIYFDQETLDFTRFRWFGEPPCFPLRGLRDDTKFPVAKHTKGNASGKKLNRPNLRIVKGHLFESVSSIEELIERLLGKDVAFAE